MIGGVATRLCAVYIAAASSCGKTWLPFQSNHPALEGAPSGPSAARKATFQTRVRLLSTRLAKDDQLLCAQKAPPPWKRGPEASWRGICLAGAGRAASLRLPFFIYASLPIIRPGPPDATQRISTLLRLRQRSQAIGCMWLRHGPDLQGPFRSCDRRVDGRVGVRQASSGQGRVLHADGGGRTNAYLGCCDMRPASRNY